MKMKSGFSPDRNLLSNSMFLDCKIVSDKRLQRIAEGSSMDSRKFRFKLTLSNASLTFLNKLEEYTKSITD
jgi:hypothetical protein